MWRQPPSAVPAWSKTRRPDLIADDSNPLVMKTLRHLRAIGILLLLMMAIGTAGYHYIEGWPGSMVSTWW